MSSSTALALYDRLKREVAVGNTAVTTISGRARLILAIDATASRQPTWDRACQIQGEMFGAVAGLGGLDVKLMFFRGYDECRASRWLHTATELHRAMAAVSCVGGETQIARVLEHTIAETQRQRIQALVFVGDCMEESADRLCRLASNLGGLSVPIFILHEGAEPVAGSTFREMCRRARGAYLPFDLSSIDQLRRLLGGIAAYAAGGDVALERYSRDKKIAGPVLHLTQQLRRGG